MEAWCAERERGGAYRGIADLASRSGAGRDGLERLAWAGALDGLAADGLDGRPGGDRAGRTRRGARRCGRPGAAATGGGTGEDAQLALPLEPPRAPELEPLGEWGRRSPTTARPG